MPDVGLHVGGRTYAGWKGVKITRSIESVAGSFELGVSDRWGGQEEPWPIAEEDACRVAIGDEVVITGYVDKRSLSISGEARTLTYSGRDRASAFVDSSALLDRWCFRNATIADVIKAVAVPFGISVSIQEGLVLPKLPAKFVIDPGDTAYEVIEKAAGSTGVLVVSDGRGGVVITRAGTKRAPALIEGKNVKAASVEYDAKDRFHRYVVVTQVKGTDTSSGIKSTRIRAEAVDEGMRRTDRVLLVRPQTGVSTEYARRRADWEARIRAAKAETVSVTVQGWIADGALWPLNAITHAEVPGIGVRGDMLISQLDHTLDESGEITTLRLVRPDAFTPEPYQAVVKAGKGIAWKDLAGGAR